jgi:hypothetical protein
MEPAMEPPMEPPMDPEPLAAAPAPEPTPELPAEPPVLPTAAPEPAPAFDLKADQKTRPDGTPGGLDAYLPKPFPPFIPKDAAINVALATRPKEYYQVNVPKPPPPPAGTVMTEPPPPGARGPLDIQEDILRGDSLARFASTRVDPDRPLPEPELGEDDAIVEIELISTGGTAEGEAHRAELIAAHPEGKPIRVIRYGPRAPASITPASITPDRDDETPDTS